MSSIFVLYVGVTLNHRFSNSILVSFLNFLHLQVSNHNEEMQNIKMAQIYFL